MSKVYELYMCKYKGEIVYIGQGLKGRHLHCASGLSHVYELNEIFFTDKENPCEVEVVKYYTNQKEVLEVEKSLILKHKPRFNKVHVHNGRLERLKRGNSVAKVLRCSNPFLIMSENSKKYSQLVEEFLSQFRPVDVLDKKIEIHSKMFYESIGLDRLAKFSYYVRTGHKQKGKAVTVDKTFADLLLSKFDINVHECIADKRPNLVKV